MTLGQRTLRADAVPIAAISVLQFLWGDSVELQNSKSEVRSLNARTEALEFQILDF